MINHHFPWLHQFLPSLRVADNLLLKFAHNTLPLHSFPLILTHNSIDQMLPPIDRHPQSKRNSLLNLPLNPQHRAYVH